MTEVSEKKENYVETPLMKQYFGIKRKHPDAILLFRVGDFYETFGGDAIKTAEILGITLTRRANGSAQFVELAGFPYHSLDTYLPRLVRAGQRVAICEQLEDPKLTKSIVKRGIIELVTPGVTLNENVLERKENNFLACVHFGKIASGVAFLDISTGEFLTAEGTNEYIDKLLSSYSPKEILVERGRLSHFKETFGTKFYLSMLDDWAFTEESASGRLAKQFETHTLKGFGVDQLRNGIVAAGATLLYLDITQHEHIKHITGLARIEEEKYVWLDKFTIRNLELVGSMHEGGRTLSYVIDKTLSPMGARLLKRWILLPLKDVSAINERLQGVEYFYKNIDPFDDITALIRQVGDLERIISKVAMSRINPREVLQLKIALQAVVPIKKICEESMEPSLLHVSEQLNPCSQIRDKIERELSSDCPNMIQRGGVIANGVHPMLDELRNIQVSGKDYLNMVQQRESERTGIPSLKVSFNNVFGYYIEVRNTHKDKVPSDWIRKQTLVSAERYITEELKEYESKILGAEEKILQLETELYNNLVTSISEYIHAIQLNAILVAKLDCYQSLSMVARERKYVRPIVNDTDIIDIRLGRHPVIETQLSTDEVYIANDVLLDSNDQQIIIITGPNMSGKSALLRQTALIVLLAQMGSFVPAESAEIGIVDKIFTRVGASDNISAGESTFMVEMLETASILNNISHRSLILLDEIGRGTSTYDGISIAWAMVEHIHEHAGARAKTLFATHYHELNELEKTFGRIKNYNVSIKELEKKIIFLRKLVPGGSAHSFGIHVARMAGMPKSVVVRAEEILKEMELSQKDELPARPNAEIGKKREGYQMSIFQLDDPVLKQIRDEIKHLNINNLTPIEALNKLNEIKKFIGL